VPKVTVRAENWMVRAALILVHDVDGHGARRHRTGDRRRGRAGRPAELDGPRRRGEGVQGDVEAAIAVDHPVVDDGIGTVCVRTFEPNVSVRFTAA
jgi:hypothetical protein